MWSAKATFRRLALLLFSNPPVPLRDISRLVVSAALAASAFSATLAVGGGCAATAGGSADGTTPVRLDAATSVDEGGPLAARPASADRQRWVAVCGGLCGGSRAARAAAVAARLSPALARPVRAPVLACDDVCAYAWRDGTVYVTAALVDRLDDEELAAAIAHELGHLVADGHLRAIAALDGGAALDGKAAPNIGATCAAGHPGRPCVNPLPTAARGGRELLADLPAPASIVAAPSSAAHSAISHAAPPPNRLPSPPASPIHIASADASAVELEERADEAGLSVLRAIGADPATMTRMLRTVRRSAALPPAALASLDERVRHLEGLSTGGFAAR